MGSTRGSLRKPFGCQVSIPQATPPRVLLANNGIGLHGLARKRKKSQFHADFIHQPPKPLHPTGTLWPFEAWGMDMVGPINPPSSNGHKFIFAVTDYFSKWAEAAPFKEIKTSTVLEFLRVNVIF